MSFQVNLPLDAYLAHLAEEFGSEVAETIDFVETHHEDVGAERIEGIVTAFYGVAQRSDGQYTVGGAPSTAPSLHDIPRVPWPPRFGEAGSALVTAAPQVAGYLVDVAPSSP